MAITEDGNFKIESTGAVEYQPPQDPPGINPEDAGKSTGAVKYTGPVGGKKVTNPNAADGGQADVRVDPPGGPVTMTSSWLSDAQAKVVTKQQQAAAADSVKEGPRKSPLAETPDEDPAKVEKKQAEQPPDPGAVERPGGDDKPAGEPSGPNKPEGTEESPGEQPAPEPSKTADPEPVKEPAKTPDPDPAEPEKHGGRRAAKTEKE